MSIHIFEKKKRLKKIAFRTISWAVDPEPGLASLSSVLIKSEGT